MSPMPGADSRIWFITIALAMTFFGWSCSLADEKPQVSLRHYPAVHVQNHQFLCKAENAEFVLRSEWKPDGGYPEIEFVSAEFNGRDTPVSQEIHDIFENLVNVKLVSGECTDQLGSIGVVLTSDTKIKGSPEVRLYFHLTSTEVKFYELVCGTVNTTDSYPEEISNLCKEKPK